MNNNFKIVFFQFMVLIHCIIASVAFGFANGCTVCPGGNVYYFIMLCTNEHDLLAVQHILTCHRTDNLVKLCEMKQHPVNGCTVCPRSNVYHYIAAPCVEMDMTSWPYSIFWVAIEQITLSNCGRWSNILNYLCV